MVEKSRIFGFRGVKINLHKYFFNLLKNCFLQIKLFIEIGNFSGQKRPQYLILTWVCSTFAINWESTLISNCLDFTLAPLTLNTGVALTDSAAVISPVNSEINTIPSRIHMMQKARAYGDFGDLSPYLYKRTKFEIFKISHKSF